MNSGSVSIASFTCGLCDLTAHTQEAGKLETIFGLDESFCLQVTVGFAGAGAIALLALKPTIRVEFFAKGWGLADELALGQVLLESNPTQFLYEPILSLTSGLGKVGGVTETVYKISALVRVGAPNFPAVVTGLIEGLVIQTYNQ